MRSHQFLHSLPRFKDLNLNTWVTSFWSKNAVFKELCLIKIRFFTWLFIQNGMANINLLETVTNFPFVSGYCPSCRIQRKQGVSRSVSVIVLRWNGGETATKMDPTESAVVCHWTYHFVLWTHCNGVELILSLAQLFIVNWWKMYLHYIDITTTTCFGF